MQPNFLILLFCAGLALLAGCGEATPTQGQATLSSAYTHKLAIGRTFKLGVDSFTVPQLASNYYAYSPLGDQQLVLLNKKMNRLQFYDLARNQLVRTLDLAREGPDGLGRIDAFLLAAPDSIYTLSKARYEICLVDSTAHVRRRYRLLRDGAKLAPDGRLAKTGNYSADLFARTGCPFYKIGPALYVMCFPDLNWDQKEFFTEGLVSLRLDLASGDFAYHTPLPEIYRKRGPFVSSVIDFGWAYNPHLQHFVYNFMADPQLYLADLNLRPLEAKWAGSQYFAEVATMPRKAEDDLKMEQDFSEENYAFNFMLFDPFRRVYYRFVFHPAVPTRLPKKETIAKVPRASVIILDESLQKLGETKLPFVLGLTGGAFVTEEGLVLDGIDWEANPNSDNSDWEDNLVFTVLKLEKIK